MSALASDVLDDQAETLTAPAVQPGTSAPALHVVPPVTGRSDGLIRVRVAPLVSTHDDSPANEDAATETVMDMQLIVDYTRSLARRTAVSVRSCEVDFVEHMHQHPMGVSCLRCAVLGASRNLTLATTLLEILVRTNADEEWNIDSSCTDTKIISRLRRLAISASTLEEIYGPYWAQVMLTCLRIEAADFALLRHVAPKNDESRVLTVHTRHALAAYHLAMVTCPWTGSGQAPVTSMLRGAVGVRLAVAVASVAVGKPPAWLDYLPAPAL